MGARDVADVGPAASPGLGNKERPAPSPCPTPDHTLPGRPQDLGAHNRASTVFLNHAPGGVNDIANQIRGAFMEANAAGLPGSSGAGPSLPPKKTA